MSGYSGGELTTSSTPTPSPATTTAPSADATTNAPSTDTTDGESSESSSVAVYGVGAAILVM